MTSWMDTSFKRSGGTRNVGLNAPGGSEGICFDLSLGSEFIVACSVAVYRGKGLSDD